jgi:YidC/Oxa1 family membrane protein insertase
MDKKNTTIGVLLLAAAFVSLHFSQKFAPAPNPNQVIGAPDASAPATGAVTSPATPATNAVAPGSTPTAATARSRNTGEFAPIVSPPAGAVITALSNEFITAHFTDFGGAIRDVQMHKYPAGLDGKEPFSFNEVHAEPMLGFVDFPGLDRNTGYQLVSQSATEVVYRTVLDGRIEVTRRYTLAAKSGPGLDPYQLHHETTFRNLTDQALPVSSLKPVELSLGTAVPSNDTVYGQIITAGYSNGKKQTFTPATKLASSNGFAGFGAHPSAPFIEQPVFAQQKNAQGAEVSAPALAWASLSNEFFTSILTPKEPGSALIMRRVKILPDLPDTDRNAIGLTGSAQFRLAPLAPHASATLAMDFYVGPKEYKRLANGDVFKADQDKVMQFGFFGFFSQLLITLMTWMHAIIPNWGVAIILTTLTIKAVFLPLTLKASRSMKRMQKLQPEMKALKEKYKDNPQKQQSALMELYKQHKINPLGGCIPMLLPLPFFYGFYRMLYNTAELRFQPFLWARDLSAPDTVAHVLGYPLNILPLLMGATMLIQASLTPTPTVDNAQAKMMKFMPLVFVLFCYNYSCALSLYFFVNGLFSIIQQLIINRTKDPLPLPAAPALATAGGRSLKNVTPKKKKR